MAAKVWLPEARTDWFFFDSGSRLLLGDRPDWATLTGGLHAYANYGLQIGPLTYALVAVLRPIGGRTAAAVLMAACGVLMVRLLERSSTSVAPTASSGRKVFALSGGAVVVLSWTVLAVQYVHIDDGLTLVAACVAIWAVQRQRPLTAGVSIAVAAAAKPWGVALLPLVLAFRGRHRFSSGTLALTGLALTWLPFLIADAGTLSAGKPGVGVKAESVLHLFGVAEGSAPGWIRPLQLAAALALGTLAVQRGRWRGLLMIVVAIRLIFDPAVFDYYTSGFILGVFAWEFLTGRWPVPVVTGTAFWALQLAGQNLDQPTLEAVLRLAICALAIVLALVIEPVDEIPGLSSNKLHADALGVPFRVLRDPRHRS